MNDQQREKAYNYYVKNRFKIRRGTDELKESEKPTNLDSPEKWSFENWLWYISH